MGAIRPTSTHMRFAQSRAGIRYAKGTRKAGRPLTPQQRQLLDSLAMIAEEGPPAGYDPSIRRATCMQCGNLTWHKDGICTEC